MGLDIDTVLTTTRAVRRRLDLTRPVDPQLIRECLEIGLQAPTGSNMQGWQFVVVTEAETREKLAAIYRKAFDVYRGMRFNAGQVYTGDDEARVAQQNRVMSSAEYLAEHLHEAPVHVIPCIEGRIDAASNIMASSLLGSIIPAAWSFMLAARARSLGTSYTTLHLMFEAEAAEVLGIPFGEFTQTALIPVAHVTGDPFRPAQREPLDKVVHWERW